MYNQDFEVAINTIKPYLSQYLEEQGIDISKKFTCPFPDHTDSTPSANIVGKDTDSPRIYCHGCGRSADIFDTVQLIEKKPNIGREWIEDTLKYLAARYQVEVITKDLTDEEIYELDTYRAYRAAAELVSSINTDPKKHKLFLEHLKFRGWTTESLEQLDVGTVTSYSNFRESLKSQGFSASFLDEIDLGRKDIFNEENMIFVWKDSRSRPIGFTSRNLKFSKNGNQPKYNNQRTTGLKCNIFKKGSRLYGIDTAVKAGSPLYIFEGQADAITAKHHGLLNCVALAGSALRNDHVFLLKELGIYDIVLCLDGDDTGRKKLVEILEERFAGHKEMKVSVVIMPDGEDPDSYIRKEGIDGFRQLAHWSAFEWRLLQYDLDKEDPYDVCRQMIPFIVNETSPIAREGLCNKLASQTGVKLNAIRQELSALLDARQLVKSRERQNVLDRTIHELKQCPSDAELILQKGQSNLRELSKKHDSDNLSIEDCIKDLDEQKAREEEDDSPNVGFELGKDLRELQDKLRGTWSSDVFMCFGGKPNVGKSAILSKIAYSIAVNNPDVCVIYHTIDDTRNQLSPRFVAIAEGTHGLSINMVRQPKLWHKLIGDNSILEKRDKGYNIVRQLVQDGRLIIKDINHGASLPFAENLISYYQDKYPERRVVYVLDNVHKLRDFAGKDERVKYKEISQACKDISLRYHICFMSSVEYTKLAPGIKPTNYNIAETGQIEYDANFIAHLYSEVNDIPDACTVFHKGIDWRGKESLLPRVEIIIGKNKITDDKGSIFLDFYPASSDYRQVDQNTVVEDSKAVRDAKKYNKDVDEAFEGMA